MHVLRISSLIDSEGDQADPHIASFSGFLGVFSPDEMSQDRRRCYAILICQSRLGTGASKSRKKKCAQKSLAKATDRMP